MISIDYVIIHNFCNFKYSISQLQERILRKIFHHRGTEDTELAFLFAHRETTMAKKSAHVLRVNLAFW
jgi:hypothetical protein